MDSSWTDVFYEKLIGSKLVTCSLVFTRSKLQKKHSRKNNTPLFQCYARCQHRICPLRVQIKMAQPISVGHNVVFRVCLTGTRQHDDPSLATARPLKGNKRRQMGK